MSWPDFTICLTASGYSSVQRPLVKKVPGICSRSSMRIRRQTPTLPP